MSKNIVILGSTGSIGTQALDVAKKGGFRVLGLAAGKNAELLEKQAREFSPLYVTLFDEDGAKELKLRLADTSIKVLSGEEGVCELAAIREADTVLNSIVGIAGLKPTMSAIKAGKTLALANKESLVTGGELVMSAAREANVKILPVDSEHSAIFQSLLGAPEGSLKKILLTASGGPFFGKTYAELEKVTAADALKHPSWNMGAKITVDSSTLMNKGFEVIEAAHLFGVSVDDVEVLIHRQSILHSAVELSDGAIIGQLGAPDMRLPIQFALTYPQRMPCPTNKLSLCDVGTLTFEKPDRENFPCLDICINAQRAGGLKTAAVNGANEAAVALFLKGKIKYTEIAKLVLKACEAEKRTGKFTIDDVFDADKKAREIVFNG